MKKRRPTGIFNRYFNNNKGATSVLIILLLVVLMIFGLTILTTTLSNESLSNKKNEWLTDYYALETEAALKLAEIDHQIQAVKEDVSEMSENRDQVLLSHLKESIEGLMKEDGKLYFWVDVIDESSEYKKMITVQGEIIVPDNTVDTRTFLDTKNYEIVLYSESQELFEYKDIEFGVPYAPDED